MHVHAHDVCVYVCVCVCVCLSGARLTGTRRANTAAGGTEQGLAPAHNSAAGPDDAGGCATFRLGCKRPGALHRRGRVGGTRCLLGRMGRVGLAHSLARRVCSRPGVARCVLWRPRCCGVRTAVCCGVPCTRRLALLPCTRRLALLVSLAPRLPSLALACLCLVAALRASCAPADLALAWRSLGTCPACRA